MCEGELCFLYQHRSNSWFCQNCKEASKLFIWIIQGSRGKLVNIVGWLQKASPGSKSEADSQAQVQYRLQRSHKLPTPISDQPMEVMS